jgi:hypothetical protein
MECWYSDGIPTRKSELKMTSSKPHRTFGQSGCLVGIAAALITTFGAIFVAYMNRSAVTNHNAESNSNVVDKTPNRNQTSTVTTDESISSEVRHPGPQTAKTPERKTDSTPKLARFTVIQSEVIFQLMEARFEGNNLVFWFLATNQGAEGEICLAYNSFLTDEDGNQHGHPRRTAGGNRGSGDCFWVTLPNRVPTRFGLIFNTVPPTATHIPFLEIRLQGLPPVQINEDIPIPYVRSKG